MAQETIIIQTTSARSALDQVRDLIRATPIRQLFDAWLEARKGKVLPCKPDLDPISFPEALSYCWIYEYLPEIPNFRCRLAGEEVQSAWGTRTVGKLVSDYLPHHHREEVVERWVELMETPQIQLGKIKKLGNQEVERLCLPVTDENGVPKYLFGATTYNQGVAVERFVSSTGYPNTMVLHDPIYQVYCSDI